MIGRDLQAGMTIQGRAIAFVSDVFIPYCGVRLKVRRIVFTDGWEMLANYFQEFPIKKPGEVPADTPQTVDSKQVRVKGDRTLNDIPHISTIEP